MRNIHIPLELPKDNLSLSDISFTSTALRRSDGDITLEVFSPQEILEDFEARFPRVFETFTRVGIHPTKSFPILNPYTETLETEDFTNIGEHCIAVGYAASKLVVALAQTDFMQEEEAERIIERALVHDLNKPYEIMRRKFMGGDATEQIYTPTAYEKLRPLLFETGVSHDTASYLMAAGQETGHNSLKDFIALGEGGIVGTIPGRLAEKVVHLADNMTFTSTPRAAHQKPVTAFLTPKDRIFASGFIEKYPWMWSKGLGVNDSGSVKEISDVSSLPKDLTLLGNYAELQVLVSRALAREFQLYLEPTSTEDPALFILNLIRDKR